MLYCFKCGTKNYTGARLCPTCGGTLRRPQTAQQDRAAGAGADAGNERPQGTHNSTTVVVARGPVRVPRLCPRCLSADTAVLVGHSGDDHLIERNWPYHAFECLTLQMPYCSRCAAWIGRKRILARALGLGIGAAGLAGNIAYGWPRGELIVWGLCGGLVWQAIDWFGEPVRIRRWSSKEMRLWFASAHYAQLFAAANNVRVGARDK